MTPSSHSVLATKKLFQFLKQFFAWNSSCPFNLSCCWPPLISASLHTPSRSSWVSQCIQFLCLENIFVFILSIFSLSPQKTYMHNNIRYRLCLIDHCMPSASERARHIEHKEISTPSCWFMFLLWSCLGDANVTMKAQTDWSAFRFELIRNRVFIWTGCFPYPEVQKAWNCRVLSNMIIMYEYLCPHQLRLL